MANLKQTIHCNYFMPEEVKYKHKGKYYGFGFPGRYIEAVFLPEFMQPGEEITSVHYPIVILHRGQSIIREFFSKPYFYVVDRISLQFHWEGIAIVGASMESKNKFTFKFPRKNSRRYRWFLKVICEGNAKPGFKPFYMSVDTYHENILLKWLLYFSKYSSFLVMILFMFVLFFGYDLGIVRRFMLGDLLTSDNATLITASPVIITIILFLSFWKKIDEAFKSFYEKQIPELKKNRDKEGNKLAMDSYGVTIQKAKSDDGMINAHVLTNYDRMLYSVNMDDGMIDDGSIGKRVDAEATEKQNSNKPHPSTAKPQNSFLANLKNAICSLFNRNKHNSEVHSTEKRS